jgi:hypothetical protein
MRPDDTQRTHAQEKMHIQACIAHTLAVRQQSTSKANTLAGLLYDAAAYMPMHMPTTAACLSQYAVPLY